MYQIIDELNGKIVGVFASFKTARRKADKLDMDNGAARYTVRRMTVVSSDHRTSEIA